MVEGTRRPDDLVPRTDSPAPGAGEGSVLADGRYLQTTYAVERAPYGSYPYQLGALLRDRYFRGTGRLLDVGCGRGEHLAVFRSLGCDVAGIDISPQAPSLAGPDFDVRVANLETAPLPFPPGSFDLVFSKSVIEHCRSPVTVLARCREALRPGGTAVIMTPSWQHTYWGPFYIDHTHITPFTGPSLADALTLAGLEVERVEFFHQLPFLWRHGYLVPVIRLLAALPVPYRPFSTIGWPEPVNKFIRFSKEVMLLAVARKPNT